MNRFNEENFRTICDHLTGIDADLKSVVEKYGYPPLWTRENNFATLILTILEQQVSLASAFAAFKRLKEKLPLLGPQEFLKLSDEELKQCSFSRQKIIYGRGLATALVNEEISLQQFEFEEDEVVRTTLKKLKGIGNWTIDIYLIHALRRLDVFPTGDLALVNALKEIKRLPSETGPEQLLKIAESWVPYRSIATMICWHYYIKKRNLKMPS